MNGYPDCEGDHQGIPMPACRRMGCEATGVLRNGQLCEPCNGALLDRAVKARVHGGRAATIAEHGTHSRRVLGCGCQACRDADAAYGRSYRALRNRRNRTGLVDASVSRALVVMLTERWTWTDLESVGISRSLTARLLRGDATRIRAESARRVYAAARLLGARRRTGKPALDRVA